MVSELRKKALWLASFLFLIPLISWAQEPSLTFRNPKDSAVNYYLTIPPVGPPKGLLMLLHGFGESPEYVNGETELPKEAARQGLLTVLVTLQRGWQSFYVDEDSQQTLADIINEIQSKHKLTGKKLYLGGFSLGGSGVVRYAELAMAGNSLPKPTAIFAVDPPLDFTRLYQSSLRQRKYGKVEVAVKEAQFLMDKMDKEFGGPPTVQPAKYVALSPYSYTDTTAHNANLLKNTPIRLISEPDLLWQMNERNRDLYEQNTIDCVSLINYLRLIGNKQAIYVPTVNKGYRKQQGNRNPHSWSIADPNDTVAWLLSY
ncbi:alpha/beta hydrolase family protein [Spirosoma fluminis]